MKIKENEGSYSKREDKQQEKRSDWQLVNWNMPVVRSERPEEILLAQTHGFLLPVYRR